MSEQEQIAILVDQSSRTTEQAIDHAQREIALLREYRTRLIADVVTGKLDVCAAAAALPEEVEELEAAEAIDDEKPRDEEPEFIEQLTDVYE